MERKQASSWEKEPISSLKYSRAQMERSLAGLVGSHRPTFDTTNAAASDLDEMVLETHDRARTRTTRRTSKLLANRTRTKKLVQRKQVSEAAFDRTKISRSISVPNWYPTPFFVSRTRTLSRELYLLVAMKRSKRERNQPDLVQTR